MEQRLIDQIRADPDMTGMLAELFFEQHHNHPAMQPAFLQQVRTQRSRARHHLLQQLACWACRTSRPAPRLADPPSATSSQQTTIMSAPE